MSCCEGLRVARRQRKEAGECNFCHRPHFAVFELQGEHPSCTFVVRMCNRCVQELRKQVG